MVRRKWPPGAPGLREWLHHMATTANLAKGGFCRNGASIGDLHEVHRLGARFGLSGEAARAIMRDEGWELSETKFAGLKTWLPPPAASSNHRP